MILLCLLHVLLASHFVSTKEVCVEGFAMDWYCINRGTLLDNPSVVSLDEPDRHSVHCLVDVERCWKSGYEILLPNPTGDPKFGRAYRLDDRGNDLVIQVARGVGMSGGCSTCKGNGTLKAGFRATIVGEVTTVSDGPNLLTVKSLIASPKLFNSSASDGCLPGTKETNIQLYLESGGDRKPSIAHGSLMIISWGLLLPTGIISAHFLKHRPNALWFKMHRIIQVSGLIIAIIGWSVALASFDVFTIKDRSFAHGVLGIIVMIIGILQPLNALLRPHPAEKGQSKPFKRLVWEILHKASGYIGALLAAVTIVLGTTIIFGHKAAFQAAWGVTLGWAIIFAIASAWDRHRYQSAQVNSGAGNGGL